MVTHDGRQNSPVHDLTDTDDHAWTQQWNQVPDQWRTLRHQIDSPLGRQVFLLNRRYLTDAGAARVHDFTPNGVPDRFCHELQWWLWLCADQGIRKVDPTLLKMAGPALAAAATEFGTEHHRPPASIAELTPDTIIRHAMLAFQRRNQRLPSKDTRRNFTGMIGHLHLYVSVRCSARPWWEHDVWDLRADPRIPQREHEPAHDRVIRLHTIEPLWLREGLRYWFRTALTGELLRWTTVVGRALDMPRLFGSYLVAHSIDHPAISTDRTQLRSVFNAFAEHLASPATTTTGRPPSVDQVLAAKTQIQSFYTFMVDNAEDAATQTGDSRWLDLDDAHTRLWGATRRNRKRPAPPELQWYSTDVLQQMLCYLDVLAADRGKPTPITLPDGSLVIAAGLGDPQAARVWLLQALTGRRASEILMLDHNPLEAIPGQERPTAPDTTPDDTFVAKLRYQQTKVDGVTPTILVEQAVVNVIEEQQQWLADHHPNLTPKYLFLGIRHHFDGKRPRTYNSYGAILTKLDNIHGIVDTLGEPVRFSQTHRLRHTRATELLNDGVPIHVVQRYLGHASPEMTMRYAATLAATAEAEFLRHKKIGAHGATIALSPSDIYDMTQLAQRTDRILPNGVCLLPPLKSCDKGNACLTCGHFATDATHITDLEDQRDQTIDLIDRRRCQYRERTGGELTDDNVWISQRRREIVSIDAILTRLHNDTEGDDRTGSVAGAGTTNRQPAQQIKTRGSHQAALDKAALDKRDER